MMRVPRSFACRCTVMAFLLVAGSAGGHAAHPRSAIGRARQLRSAEEDVTGPTAALSGALSAACRANQQEFAGYLTPQSAAAFQALPDKERVDFMQRFSLLDAPGKPLLASDAQAHPLLRCESTDATVEYHFGSPRMGDNLAFVPVTIEGRQTQFGLIRQASGWHLLSTGLVLLDVPQLAAQWRQEEAGAHDQAVAQTLRDLAGAIEKYRKMFGKMPDSLAQLGPAPKNDVSADHADMVDGHLAAGEAGGYKFRYRVAGAAGSESDAEPAFELAAIPAQYGATGKLSFLYDTSGKIHAADKHGGLAVPGDALFQPEKAAYQGR